MRYQRFLDIVLGRARTLRFEDPDTKQVDAAEVELAAYYALLWIVDGWDLDIFTTFDDAIATTTAGKRDYKLPSDFARLQVPRDKRESGIFLLTTSGQQPNPLFYRDYDDWYRRRSTTNGTPSYFVIQDNDTLLLDPPPDDNGGSNYTIQGVYIREVDQLDDNDPILVSHPTALIELTLAQLAEDKGATQRVELRNKANSSVSRLVNNQARIRQRFRPRHLNERSLRTGGSQEQ